MKPLQVEGPERRPPPLATLDEQLAALDHANGWVRDRAQRRIVYQASESAAAALRRLESFGPVTSVSRSKGGVE